MNKIFVLLFVSTILAMNLQLAKTATTPKLFRKWENNQVYFKFEVQFDEKYMRMIRNAVKELENLVCVNITEITDPLWKSPDKNQPIKIINANGCWSLIGDNNLEKQELSLTPGKCLSASTVKHEFMHLLGLEHEQSRSDRDEYLQVYNDRIKDHVKNQFEDIPSVNYGPFDFQSNMLYDPWGMSKLAGRPIWTIKNKHNGPVEVVVEGSISWQDAKTLNQIYKCGANCKILCGPNAYLNKNCECITPDKFADNQCYDVRNDCQSWLHQCRADLELTGECRKTCKTCYKSPNGRGDRGTIEICDDWNEWSDGFCRELRGSTRAKIEEECKEEDAKYFCRKTCNSGCAYLEITKVVDECQDFDPLCGISTEFCDSSHHKDKCAKTCGYCT